MFTFDDPGWDDQPSPELFKRHYDHLAQLISGHEEKCDCTGARTPPTRIDRACEEETSDNGDETPPEEETS